MAEFLIVLACYIAAFILVGAIAYGVTVCALVAQAVAKAAIVEVRPGLRKAAETLVGHFGSWTRDAFGYSGDRAAKKAGTRLPGYSYDGRSLAAQFRELDRAVTEVIILHARLEKADEEDEDDLYALQDRLESKRNGRPTADWSPWHGRRSQNWKEHRSSQYR